MRADRPLRVLVTDAERSSALSIIRSLSARGHWVAAASADARVPAWRSRATRARVRYPSPRVDADGAVTRIAEACRRLSVDIVFPVTDDIGLPLARMLDRIPARVLLPDAEALHAVTDKQETLRLAAACGIPTPQTVVASERLRWAGPGARARLADRRQAPRVAFRLGRRGSRSRGCVRLERDRARRTCRPAPARPGCPAPAIRGRPGRGDRTAP